MSRGLAWVLAGAVALLAGCATSPPAERTGVKPPPSAREMLLSLPSQTRSNLLALDPSRVTEREVRELLAPLPAPQILSIHGGIFPIRAGMNSFAQFLIDLGYPEASIRNPGNGYYTYGYYDNSQMIAGNLAWYYEYHGLRPILVGHSQGGIMVIRVLHRLAGDGVKHLAVWNPVTQKKEKRHTITDPLTGTNREVVGLKIGFATVATAGGLARALPNEWDMNSKLRKIPDSVEEFTGFQKGMDMAGGDYFGFGTANDYYPMGGAQVRNVRLPATSPHWTIPYADGLLEKPEVRQWIEAYEPPKQDQVAPESYPDWMNARILWAAEVWHGIKKHWVLELQRLLRARNIEP